MGTFDDDPIINAVHRGIKDDIDFVLSNRRLGAAVILIYSAMDAMACLDMPETQTQVTGADFIKWVDRYIRFPCRDQITGEELYSARCGMLHTYTIESKKTRSGKCRMISYCDRSIPEIRFDAKIAPNLVGVSIQAMKDALFRGIDDFLVHAFSDPSRIPVLEARLESLVQMFPYPKSSDHPEAPR